jgi:glycosyltransferase involved in cell wall biosynthesis
MRILGVFPAYEPAWAFGGVVRCTSNLFRALAMLGADVTVYTTDADGKGGHLTVPVGEVVDVAGVNVMYFSPSLGSSIWHSRDMVRKVRETISDFDVVYVSAMWQWIGVQVTKVARQQGVPCVVGTHGSLDSVLLQNKRLKKLLYWHLFLKKSLLRASAVHFTTDYERRQSRLLDSRHHSFIVPNCLPYGSCPVGNGSRHELRRMFELPEDMPVLVTVGRPDPKKKFEILIRACQRLTTRGLDFRLLFVGSFENSYGKQLQDLVRSLGLTDKVIWAGYRTGDDLQRCYGGADLFVLPSSDENFGMVVIEAMAHGLPVVISRHVGVADDIQAYRAGHVVDSEVASIVGAVLSLLDGIELRREMGARARSAAMQLYGGEQVAKLMTRAFEDVTCGRRSQECRWL